MGRDLLDDVVDAIDHILSAPEAEDASDYTMDAVSICECIKKHGEWKSGKQIIEYAVPTLADQKMQALTQAKASLEASLRSTKDELANVKADRDRLKANALCGKLSETSKAHRFAKEQEKTIRSLKETIREGSKQLEDMTNDLDKLSRMLDKKDDEVEQLKEELNTVLDKLFQETGLSLCYRCRKFKKPHARYKICEECVDTIIKDYVPKREVPESSGKLYVDKEVARTMSNLRGEDE